MRPRNTYSCKATRYHTRLQQATVDSEVRLRYHITEASLTDFNITDVQNPDGTAYGPKKPGLCGGSFCFDPNVDREAEKQCSTLSCFEPWQDQEGMQGSEDEVYECLSYPRDQSVVGCLCLQEAQLVRVIPVTRVSPSDHRQSQLMCFWLPRRKCKAATPLECTTG